jgi:hypothetical protein
MVHQSVHDRQFGGPRIAEQMRNPFILQDIAADYVTRSCADLVTAVDSSRANISSLKSTNTRTSN